MKPVDYARPLPGDGTDGPVRLRTVESEVDLYWEIALEIYLTIEQANRAGEGCALILPVGPVFQYRRLVDLLRRRPLDLSRVGLFFMDEYLSDPTTLIDPDDPLSFRGFIGRELVQPLGGALPEDQVLFPDPRDPAAYDARLAAMGGATLCIGGVGINGHVAFNEPPSAGTSIAAADYLRLPTRVIELTRETITINSNTALRGAFERIPRQAISVGMVQIFGAARIRLYLNRPWQSAVLWKLLFAEETAEFPVTLLRAHRDLEVIATEAVAQRPAFGLR